ncbi:MAG: L,D-transpeptidase family protein [Burkholderiaceae bacterium]|nr:L,D-transpeptidase family protein [Burkholderiaceae bacterium]
MGEPLRKPPTTCCLRPTFGRNSRQSVRASVIAALVGLLPLFANPAFAGKSEASARQPATATSSKSSKTRHSASKKTVVKGASTGRDRALKTVSLSPGLTAGALAINGTAQSLPGAREGEAEARLIEVYRLIGKAQGREALKRAESLVADYPNFQLAQLVYGDLLSSQTRPIRAFGAVPDTMAQAAGTTLPELREESLVRLKALRESPPLGTIPSQFLNLSPRTRHAIAIDTLRSRLYLFENNTTGLRLVADYYISVGKSGIEKNAEGDQRTPLGVYHITSNLDPKSLKDFYGSGALPLNYPNPYDQSRGRTGGGIWLHGTPSNQFARAPKASDGCVVLANPDLERIIRTVEVRTTPVVIARQLQWVPPQSVKAEGKSFEEALQAWRSAKTSGDVNLVLGFYTTDFRNYNKTLPEWTPTLKQEISSARGRNIELKDLSYLRWNDGADTMVATFGEVVEGSRTGPVKRQYWVRQGNQWKIFFEGVIG